MEKLKKYKPVNNSQRNLILVSKAHLHNGSSLKSLTVGATSTGGRNNMGRITTRHRGGGNKKSYRIIDFKRDKEGFAEVIRFEYDPFRTAFIALVKFEDEEFRYIIAPEKLKVGDKIHASADADIKIGNCLPMANIPVGTMVHNIEMRPGKGGQLVKAAGGYAQIVGKDSGYVMVKLRSGEVRHILANCKATIGVVCNADHKNESYAKAGRMRWKGIRPTVRGVAMNPIDHPHGGGEGKTSGGRHPVTPWGKPTKGKKTRNNKRTDKFILRSRHKNKDRR